MRKAYSRNCLNTHYGKAGFLISLLIVLALSSGCYSTAVIDGVEVWESSHEEQSARVVHLASFETDCPKEQLDVTLLEALRGGTYFPTQYGVVGCGYRMRYVHANEQWVLNSVSKDGDLKVPDEIE